MNTNVTIPQEQMEKIRTISAQTGISEAELVHHDIDLMIAEKQSPSGDWRDAATVDLTVALRAAELLRIYNRSHGVGAVDAVIAATAQVHDLPLVTLNLEHFPMFPDRQRPY